MFTDQRVNSGFAHAGNLRHPVNVTVGNNQQLLEIFFFRVIYHGFSEILPAYGILGGQAR